MNDLFFSLEKLLDYKGNRYELARACMEYAKRVRYIAPDEYKKIGEKEALVALKHLLDKDIKYTSDPFEIEIYEDEASIVASQQEAQQMKKLKREENFSNEKIKKDAEGEEKNSDQDSKSLEESTQGEATQDTPEQESDSAPK